ncbi:hypothetical protein ABC337_10185 [Arthrobacter sp. 1P04PC]|uniref:hypothetical protein n=1 Tax=Micrococcaceae TaxID=1268 RepID=UPI0039A19DEF
MTEPLRPSASASDHAPAVAPDTAVSGGSDSAVARELHRVLEQVDGVQTLYPAHPVWQNIAGAAHAAVTGETPNPVAVDASGDVVTVKARIGVATGHRAPDVARAAAAAVRAHLEPRRCAVEVAVVHIAG